jgi:membrane-bound lytic murein transglycosylase F
MNARRLLWFLAWLAAGCTIATTPVPPLAQGKKLVVVTINGPATYSEDAQGRPTGFEFDLMTLFGQELGVEVEFVLVDTPAKVDKALADKRAHVGAALLPKQFDLPGGLAWAASYHSTQHQVVWRVADPKPKSLTDLTAKRVGVIQDSFADYLLSDPPKLSTPVERMPPHTPTEDLLESLAAGQFDFALVESTRFLLLKKHFPSLDVAFNIGKPVDYAWRVGLVDQQAILDKAKAFIERISKDGTMKRLIERYYAHATRISAIDSGTLLERISTTLPKLKPWFEEGERLSGLDWRLLAAIGYQESHWDPRATSPTGVRGLMMLTEDTADRMKVKDRLDARESILGGARYFTVMWDTLPPRIKEPDRTFLTLAAYNMGIGHLEDARILAQRSGLSPDAWLDVKRVMPKMSDPATHKDLKHGFARGYETLQFVDNVRNYYDILQRMQPREAPIAPRELPPDQGSTKATGAAR